MDYATYLGGHRDNSVHGIAVDREGNAYVTGATASTDFPTDNPFQAARGTNSVGTTFISKLSPSGRELIYSTYLGGGNSDFSFETGTAIAVDREGSAYVTGFTSSTDFPTKNPFQAVKRTGTFDTNAFVTKLNRSGDQLVYSTYLGGSVNDLGAGIAVDLMGHAYVAGNTSSSDFPLANALQPSLSGGAFDTDAFITKFSPSGESLVYSTYLGGTFEDLAKAIAIDREGNAYVTGFTFSNDFPTKNAVQPTHAGGLDAFISKLNSSGTALVYSTYLGGSADDIGNAIAVDLLGNAYVTGQTVSADFPTRHALQQLNRGGNVDCSSHSVPGAPPVTCKDAFVAKLNHAGTVLKYSTYLGGSNQDSGNGIAVDVFGNAYVTGQTRSADFPTRNSLQKFNQGGNVNCSNLPMRFTDSCDDVFVTKLNCEGRVLVYSTYLGGDHSDVGNAIAVDHLGHAYVSGFTMSSNFPVKNAFEPSNPKSGSPTGFVDKIK